MNHQKKIYLDCDSEQVYDHLPSQHTKNPWLVAQFFDYETKAQEQIFYNIHHPLSKYRCRIPELTGKRIRACFHGWVVMSDYTGYDHLIWFLWNPQTSKIIQLPPFPISPGSLYQYECCLPFPPDDPNSIFLVTTSTEPKFLYFRLINHKRKNSMWTKMSYHKKLTSITGIDHCYLNCPTVSNEKIYFLSSNSRRGVRHFESCVIHVDISVRGKMYVFNLIPLVKQPLRPPINFQEKKASFCCYRSYSFLKGSSDDLFFIYLYEKKQEIYSVYLFKLNMASMSWEKMENLKDTVFFIDYPPLASGIFSPAIPISSESLRGGYIHIYKHQAWQVIKSYNVRNRTITMSPMSPHMLHTGQVTKSYDIALWSMPRYDGLQVEEEEDENESCDIVVVNDDELEFSFPFHILEMIMNFCVDVDYLKFRATCKYLAALPVIRWSNITEILLTLKKNFLRSPWSMILDRDRGVITITDPMLGNKYFIKTPHELFIGDVEIHDSGYGWLLMCKNATQDIMFFNPFTGDIRKLPHQDSCVLENLCFSAPPTSPKCMVVGFAISFLNVHISGEQSWRKLEVLYFSGDLSFPTFCGRDIYALSEGRVSVFRWDEDTYLFKAEDHLVFNTSCYNPTKYYLTKSDQHLLHVSVVESEKSVSVYKFNQSLMAWECLDSLGKDVIYITETSCLCIEAGIPKMENKIYFHESYSENGKILFYSLETHKFHTFEDNNMKGSFSDLFKRKQLLLPHTWIVPSCL